MVCTARVAAAAASSADRPSCGAIAAWAARPWKVARSFVFASSPSTAAATVRLARPIPRWAASSTSTSSTTPAGTIAAAPRPPSSAGWKRIVTRPSGGSAVNRSASSTAIPTWPSCPHACMTPSRVDRKPPAHGRVPRVVGLEDRQRVGVGPQRDVAARAPGVEGGDDGRAPVPQGGEVAGVAGPGPVAVRGGERGVEDVVVGDAQAGAGVERVGAGAHGPAQVGEPPGDPGGGAELGEPDLGVGVQVAAPGDGGAGGAGGRGHPSHRAPAVARTDPDGEGQDGAR